MALISCPECGGKVSDKAPACIHCGYPLANQCDNTCTDKFNNFEYLNLMMKLDKAANDYSKMCINNKSSDSYPSSTNVVICVKTAVNYLNGDFKGRLEEYKQLVSILCEKIISNTRYIRGKDSNIIFAELNYKDMDYSIQKVLIDKLAETRKKSAIGVNPPLDCIFDMIKYYLPSDLKLVYQNAVNYCHSDEGQRAFRQIWEDTSIKATNTLKSQNIPKCPTCGSSNVQKISTGKKAFGFAMVGLFSSNLGKTMECKNCGCKW